MRPRFLISYWYWKEVDLDEVVARFTIDGVTPDLWGDSGAYSAMTGGKVITVEEYAAWIHKWKHLLSAYCNLDVIGDPKGTMANQAALESLGVSPLPVYHMRADDWSVLTDIADRYPYACFGGMAGTHTNKFWVRFLVDALRRVKGSGTAWHALGMTSDPVLRTLPLYSTDSSSWSVPTRFGKYYLWDDAKMETIEFKCRDLPAIAAAAKVIRAHGYDPGELYDPPPGHRPGFRDMAYSMELEYYGRIEASMRLRHGEIPRLDDPLGEPGLRIYAAAGNVGHLQEMLSRRLANANLG